VRFAASVARISPAELQPWQLHVPHVAPLPWAAAHACGHER
jgi:hypothetical protein